MNGKAEASLAFGGGKWSLVRGSKADLEVLNKNLFLSQWWARAADSSARDLGVKYSGIVQAHKPLVAGNLP